MSSLDRLRIYGHAYFSRLIECLRAQYPAVRHLVEEEAFDSLAFGYLVDHPSTRYTLSSLGDSFEIYLEATRPPRLEGSESHQPDFADFVVELARLERVYSEVFDGPGPERSRSLNADDLSGLTAEEFANCCLKLHGCVRLLELQFPVHEYATAVRHQQQPTPQIARPVWLVITRRDYVVRRFEVTHPQFQLLSSLRHGAKVGEALFQLGASSIAVRASDLQIWFRDWSAAPLFERLIRDSVEVELD